MRQTLEKKAFQKAKDIELDKIFQQEWRDKNQAIQMAELQAAREAREREVAL